MNKHIIIAAALLSIGAGAVAAEPKVDVWNTGKGKWHAGVSDKECKGGTCWEYEGTYKTKKAARQAAKKAIEIKNASGVWSDGRTDGGLCSQPGVEC